MGFDLSLLYMFRFFLYKGGEWGTRSGLIIFFTNLDGKGTSDFQQPVGVADISSRISKSKLDDRILTENEGNLATGTMLLSYHNWVARELPSTTTLAAYIALWLKRCHYQSFVSNSSISIWVALGLLPAMVCASSMVWDHFLTHF